MHSLTTGSRYDMSLDTVAWPTLNAIPQTIGMYVAEHGQKSLSRRLGANLRPAPALRFRGLLESLAVSALSYFFSTTAYNRWNWRRVMPVWPGTPLHSLRPSRRSTWCRMGIGISLVRRCGLGLQPAKRRGRRHGCLQDPSAGFWAWSGDQAANCESSLVFRRPAFSRAPRDGHS